MISRRSLTALGAAPFLHAGRSSGRPNILWIITEDMGPELGCYGYPGMRTPNLDRLAGQGVRFDRAFVTAPVCSATRSAFQTGMYQTSIGAHHHRSHRDDNYRLPEGVRLVTHRLRDAGYFTIGVRKGFPVTGAKTDFNFEAGQPFEGDDWSKRPKDRPFFAQIHLRESHKGPAWSEARKQSRLVDPAKVELPPYYPDHPAVRDEFANYLDAVNLADVKVGRILEALDRENLAANTAVFFMGDHGRCLLRGKQWLYTAGVRVPLILRWPGVAQAGKVVDGLVLSLDMTATTLYAAGVALPKPFHGRPLIGPGAQPREYAVAARDRCDMTLDRVRSVRTARYNYIRNFMPERPYTQFNNYIETSYPTQGVMKKLFAEGKLNREQSLFMQPRKPAEELYDLSSDPHEVRNLAGSPQHASILRQARARLEAWMRETGDRGGEPEPYPPEEMDRRVRAAQAAEKEKRK